MSNSPNPNTVIFLVNTKCRALALAYEWCDQHGKAAGGSTVKTDIFKTFDQDLKKGDLVLGETQSRHQLCVYRVVEVDVEVNMDHGSYIPWIAGRCDDSALKGLKAREEELLAAIRQKDKERKRLELAETMTKDYGDALANLAITKGDVPALPAE